MIRTRLLSFTGRKRDTRPYYCLKVNVADKHHVEITCSPTGRSIHIYVDGERWEATP